MTVRSPPFSLRSWWLANTTGWRLWLVLIVFGAPALSGLIGRLAKSSKWLNDWNAFVCGAANAAAGAAPSDPFVACEGVRAAPYVYAPWMARLLAPFVDEFGVFALDVAYIGLLAPALALLVWVGFLRPLDGHDWRERIPFLALLTGSALACGNVSYVLHAMIAVPALFLPRARVFFVLTVAAACVVKPFYAVFLVVLLLEPRQLWRRFLTGLWAGALALAAAAASFLAPDPARGAWLAAMQHNVIELLGQSIGFAGWFAYFGMPLEGLALVIGYIVYAGVLLFAGVLLVERAGLCTKTRVALGLGLGALLNPRLMDYDLMLMALAPIVAIAALRGARGAETLWRVAFFSCVGVLVLSLADLTPLGAHLAVPMFALIVIASAVIMIRQDPSLPAGASMVGGERIELPTNGV